MTPLESPIEWRFAAAVREFIRTNVDPYYLKELPPSDLETLVKTWSADKIHARACAPQVQCGPHRVDFLFVGYTFEEAPALVAVECDGHEFHERNKLQAARDKARDRALAIMGVNVMRFAGSEIHRNPHACLREVLSFLEARSDEAFNRRHPDTVEWIERWRQEQARTRS